MIGPPLGFHGQSSQGVCGFTGLRHPHGEGIGGQRRRGVAEFAGVMHGCGNSGELLQQMRTHQRRVATGAAGQDLDLIQARIKRRIKGQRDTHLGRQSFG